MIRAGWLASLFLLLAMQASVGSRCWAAASPSTAAGEGEDGASSVAALLADADHRYGALDYRGAAEVAERAARDERATRAEQIVGWERVGLSWLVLGQRSLAREALDRLFTLEPVRVVEDPSLSPRQREFIEEVRGAHPPPPRPPALDLAPVLPIVPAPAPPTAPRPVWKRWYLWTPIAIGVVGVGLGLGLGLGLARSGPVGTLPPGTVGLSLRY